MATGRQCAVAALDSERYVSVTTLLACQQMREIVAGAVARRRGASWRLQDVAGLCTPLADRLGGRSGRRTGGRPHSCWTPRSPWTHTCAHCVPRSACSPFPVQRVRAHASIMQSYRTQACPEMLAPLGPSTLSCSRPSATRLPNTVTMLSRRVGDPCVATTVVLADRPTCQSTAIW